MVWPIVWILGGAIAGVGTVAALAASEGSKKKSLAREKPKGLGKAEDDIIDAEFVDLFGAPGSDPFYEHVKKTWDAKGGEPDEEAQEHAVNMLRESYRRLSEEAEAKTRASLDEAELKIQNSGGKITSFEVKPIPDGVPGRHIRIEWEGDPLPKLHVVKVVGQPLTSDIDRLMKNGEGKTTLVDGLTNAPASVFDPEEKTGVQTVYYAWLEATVRRSVFSVSIPELELVSKEETATAFWGLELQELLLVKPTPKPPPKPEDEAGPKSKNVPTVKVNEFTEELILAFGGVVERIAREKKLDEVLDRFVAAHGLEDDQEELASIGDAVLERYEKQLKEKGRS